MELRCVLVIVGFVFISRSGVVGPSKIRHVSWSHCGFLCLRVGALIGPGNTHAFSSGKHCASVLNGGVKVAPVLEVNKQVENVAAALRAGHFPNTCRYVAAMSANPADAILDRNASHARRGKG
ncbi:hypothetical protein D3C84_953930 [compost metagenome]